MIAAEDRRRLVRLLGMIGSDSDGEALNAAKLALRTIRDRGLTWDEVLGPAAPEEPKPIDLRRRPRSQAPQQTPAGGWQRPQERPERNVWSFIASDLMAAFAKKRRVAASDLSLVNRALNPLYQASKEEIARLRELYVAEFGKDAAAA